jgi:predicted ATP-grasp superfamily ATP-dependent carboligase
VTALVVVYGLGSAGPVDLLRAAGDDIEVRLVVDPADEHTARVGPLLDFVPLRFAMREDDPVPDGLADGAAGIVTFSERMLPRTARLAARLGLAYHSPQAARAVTDKAVQRALLSGGPRLATRFAAEPDRAGIEAVGLPAVAKPIRGEGGKNVRLLRDSSDVDALLAVPGGTAGMLVEEYLPDAAHPGNAAYGSYVSVEAFVHDDEVMSWQVTDKLRPWPGFFETGSVAPSLLPADVAYAVRDLAGEAVRRLGVVCGCVHVELKLTPGGPRVIEVNGRLGGSVAALARATAGFDAVRATMDAALGRQPAPPPRAERCATVVHIPTQVPGPVSPRLRERLRAVPGVSSVDTPFANRLLLGDGDGVPTNRLVDLTVTMPDFAGVWGTVAAALSVLREGGAVVSEGFEAYVRRVADTHAAPVR